MGRALSVKWPGAIKIRPRANTPGLTYCAFQLLVAAHHGSDLGSEVILLLLNALALLKANSILEGDSAAQLLGGGGNILLHGHGVVLDKLLLEQAVLSIELVELTNNNVLL